MVDAEGFYQDGTAPAAIAVIAGEPQYAEGVAQFSWHEVPVTEFFTDPEHQAPFTGSIMPEKSMAVDGNGKEYPVLYGNAVENSAPLTTIAFQRHLGRWGAMIVVLCVALFAVSTAISWSYYGDRCANYLMGTKAIIPFKVVYIGFHFLGAILSLNVIWNFGDVALSLVTIPNLVALVLLSGTVAKLTKSYFERKPWVENEEKHKQLKASGKL